MSSSIFVEGIDIDRATRHGRQRFGPPKPVSAELNARSRTAGDRTRTSARLDVAAKSRSARGAQFEGIFRDVQSRMESVLGWSEAEVASMSIFELLHPDDLEHTRAGFELTQVGQPALRFVNRYRCKDGSYRWISWVGIPEDGFVYCTGRDITAEQSGGSRTCGGARGACGNPRRWRRSASSPAASPMTSITF